MRLDDPSLPDELTDRAMAWVESQRRRHRPGARPLSPEERSEFEQFFNSRVMDAARIALVPLIENPGFYSELPGLDLAESLDLTQAVGIAYRDTILISERHLHPHTPWMPLIFHELVHVAQYDLLGPERFMQRYIHGWAENGFSYGAIPLESQAYELQARYQSRPGRPFVVESELRRRLDLAQGG